MSRRSLVRTVAVVAAAAGLVASGQPVAIGAPEPAGATTTVLGYRVDMRPDGTVVRTRVERSVPVFAAEPYAKPAQAAPKPPGKIDPMLAIALADPKGGDRIKLIVGFTDDVVMPRFPDADPALARDSGANAQKQRDADALVSGIRSRRQAEYQALGADLARMDIHTLSSYWLVKGMVVDAPRSAVAGLAKRADVTYIEPVHTGEAPPDSDPANDEIEARIRMGTDPFFNTGALNRGFAGILDTGVRSTHTMFNPPRPWLLRDETGSGSISDTCGNHGTSTMAIMTGNANLGDRLRGISAITTDSIKVYDCIVDPVTGQLRAGLNRDAAIRGFQTAVNIMDRTIVAEMQAVENENGLIAAAADRAFDAGAVVIAANGNFGADQNGNPIPGSVRSPAVAQKVIGIGAFDVRTGITSLSQGRGPAPDGRTKPDIQTPTNTETASNVSDTSTQVFGGTSCATAQAGGAAAYLRSFLFAANEAPPGFVYAQLIARGTSTSFLDNTTGAGPIRLPVPGQSSSFPQQVTIAGGQSVDIPVFNSTVFFNGPLRAAIWWPEAPATHNDIDLRLIAPNGAVVGSSLSIGSVYEKVSVTGLTPGEWKIRVSGFSVPGGSQTVFAGVTIDNI